MKKYKGYVRFLLLLSWHEVNINVCKSIQPLSHPLALNFGELSLCMNALLWSYYGK